MFVEKQQLRSAIYKKRNMKGACVIWLLSFLCVTVYVQCYGGSGYVPLGELIKDRMSRKRSSSTLDYVSEDASSSSEYSPVYVQNQDGLKEVDEIVSLPGQPQVNFSQYSGYVTVDPNAGRALFYYLTESEDSSSTKPLVLWLNGGPGCSSFGSGAMMELGPFRVNPDGKTLWRNKNAWNNEANVLFLESPAGVGFSYSNRSSDYITGDNQTSIDSYTFLVNWLERFPEYKTRDFYITGESYAGHYIPQLAKLILKNNKITNRTVVNLKGIAIGNALIDDEDWWNGLYNLYWTHALISDEIYQGIVQHCNISSGVLSEACLKYTNESEKAVVDIYRYDIYAPLCSSSPSSAPSISAFDPCSENYVYAYLNTPEVQKALHAIANGAWNNCNHYIRNNWQDWQSVVLPTIEELMASDIRVWIYSGDTDSVVSSITTKYSLAKIAAPITTPWYPWYVQGQVGGYAVEYQNITFVTVRGAGHLVPSYQPERALAFFSSFLEGKLPPTKS